MPETAFTRDSRFRCPFCQQTPQSPQGLLSHVRASHKGKKLSGDLARYLISTSSKRAVQKAAAKKATVTHTPELNVAKQPTPATRAGTAQRDSETVSSKDSKELGAEECPAAAAADGTSARSLLEQSLRALQGETDRISTEVEHLERLRAQLNEKQAQMRVVQEALGRFDEATAKTH